jgi:endonuclease/exonuclease/phosphatase family metal-dependent hydrolase
MRIETLALRLAISLLAVLSSMSDFTFGQSPSAKITAVSFNIRFGTAADGVNHWDKRREFLLETIKTLNPDLLGTQETLGFQRDYLAKELTDYDHLGVGRDDGKEAGEMMALYYRRARFEKLDGGHFWLSETPDVVGSKSWDSSLPRMVTWVKLRDRKQQDSPSILFFNTHFDHRGPTARLESAKLIRRKIVELGKDCRVVVTGDFNADQQSPPYEALFSAVEAQDSPVIDTYRGLHPERRAEEGTFSAFNASETKGARIDWIGVSRDWKIQSATIDRTSRDGRTPSDHFPVTATLAY